MRKYLDKIKNMLNSVKVKLFLTLSATILINIIFLIIVNSFALEKFYLYKKENTLKAVYGQINNYYNSDRYVYSNIEKELEKISAKNNFEILIIDKSNNNIYASNRNFMILSSNTFDILNKIKINSEEELEKTEKFSILKQKDVNNGIAYIMLSGKLDNGYLLFIRLPITLIEDSVKISNTFLFWIAGLTILIAAVMVSIISRKFTDPILELNDIARRMSKLDFSRKYKNTNTDDEINNLGRSINTMSDKLERTIKQLRNTNIELEKDIEEKYQLDEMRKSFISDVSHELKTPIALIQGYSEGLLENVNTDEENRKFYAEVILDETNKMDKIVKQLLELMKLEYENREFNNINFNIVELEKEVIRKSKVMIEEKSIQVELDETDNINVFADEFYIEQVLTNYLTNAIKNCKEKYGEKVIKVSNKLDSETNKVRISIFNTGDNIKDEDLNRIWNRFYKVDESRNRNDGGSGIGLAFVKAIMTNYENDFGVLNKENGVEFYFDLDLKE